MKNSYVYLKAALTLVFMLVMATAFAQTPFAGASDPTTAPPATAAAVQQVLCNGNQIQLNTTTTPGYTYQWYKKNPATGTMQLVQSGSSSAYTETPTSSGYYTYQLIVLNSNGCTSVMSDAFNVFILPAITAAISASSADVCAGGQTSSTLTATPITNTNYTYNYVWTRNGVTIPGATTNTYTVNETTAATVTFGVTVSYALNGTCGSTATQAINVIAVPTKPVIVTGP